MDYNDGPNIYELLSQNYHPPYDNSNYNDPCKVLNSGKADKEQETKH
jgi:hypothetical protein